MSLSKDFVPTLSVNRFRIRLSLWPKSEVSLIPSWSQRGDEA